MGKSKKRKTNHDHSGQTELSHDEIWDDSALIRSWNDAVAEYEYYHSIHARGEDVEAILDAVEAAEKNGIATTRTTTTKTTTTATASTQPKRVIDHGSRRGSGGEGGGNLSQAITDTGVLDEDEAEEGEVTDDEEQLSETAGSRQTRKRLGENDPGIDVEGGVDDANHDSLAQVIESRKAELKLTKTQAGQHSSGARTTEDGLALSSDGGQLPQTLNPEQHRPNGTSSRSNLTASDQALENLKMAYYWAGYYSGLYDGQRQMETTAGSVAQDAGNTRVKE